MTDHRLPDDDLPCAMVVDLITDYLDDAMSPPERTRLDDHLAECDDCVTVLDQFRTTITVTGRLASDDVDRLDEATRAQLISVFQQWAAGRPG